MRKTTQMWALGLVLAALALGGAGCSAERKRARHQGRADRYFEAKEFDKAAIEYLNALRLQATNTHVIDRLGTIYYSRGELAKAVPFLLRMEQLRPEDLSVRLRLATVFLLARQTAKAREEAIYVLDRQATNNEAMLLLSDASVTPEEVKDCRDRFQQIRPQAANQASFHVALGTLSFRDRDYNTAEDAFKEALRLDPNGMAAKVGLGNLYWARGELAQAGSLFKAAAEASPAKSRERLRWVEFNIRTGALDDAKKILEETIQEAPEFLPALIYRAEIALGEKKFDECSALIEKVLAQDAGHFEAQLLQSRLKLAQGQTTEAIKELGRLSTKNPRMARVHHLEAVAHVQNNDAVKAVASLNQALALDPTLTDATLLLAELNIRKGDAASAITALTQLVKQTPGLKRAQYLLAAGYAARGTLDDAVGVYRTVLTSDPRDGQAAFQLGLVLLQQKKPKEARAALNKALELRPDHFPSVSLLLELDLAEKDFQAALQRVQAEIAKRPQSPGPQYLLAKVYLGQGQQEQAEAALLRTIELEPDYQPAYSALARLYVASDKYEQALEKIETLLTRTPKDSSSLFLAGMIYEKKRDFAKAAETYEKLLALRPRFGLAMNNLAYLCAEYLGQVDKAHDLARKARELNPNDPFTADTLGWVLYKRADYTRALSLFEEAAEKLAAEPDVLFHLGMAHYALGEEEPARVAFQQALQLSKDFQSKPDAERRLALLTLDLKNADPSAIAALEKRVAEQPDDPIALIRLGSVHEKNGAAAKAREAYEKVLKTNPKATPAVVKLAQLYAGPLRDSKKALQLARDARNLAPEDPEIAHTLGRLAFDAGDQQWSLSLLQESARKKPGQSEVAYDLAWALYSLGRLSDAQQTMQQAIQSATAPGLKADAQRFLELAALYPNPGPAASAQARVADALKGDPDYLPALLASALLLEQAGNFDQAKPAYEKILARFPSFAPAAKQLAALYADRFGDMEKAFPLAVKARDILPDDPDLAKTLGKVVYRRGDFTWSAQLLKQSAKQRVADAEVFYYLGMAHYRLKEKKESAAALQQALALNDKDQLADEARRLLAEMQ
ncbi:MAG: tetratricopeptide repeat protein [Verrucomicrobia bacterium]|nr:tetratricopeptide repeat protein [Verrucomicrobiota bacterium]